MATPTMEVNDTIGPASTNKEEKLAATNFFSLKNHELSLAEVYRNPPLRSLYGYAIRFDKDASICGEWGARRLFAGKDWTSPKDKRVVKLPGSERDVWWGRVNSL